MFVVLFISKFFIYIFLTASSSKTQKSSSQALLLPLALENSNSFQEKNSVRFSKLRGYTHTHVYIQKKSNNKDENLLPRQEKNHEEYFLKQFELIHSLHLSLSDNNLFTSCSSAMFSNPPAYGNAAPSRQVQHRKRLRVLH